MKQYHTQIEINANIEKVWKILTDFDKYPVWNPIVGKLLGEMKENNTISTYIVPLRKTYKPVLLKYKQNKEIVWQGVQGYKWLMAGKHYYKLEELSNTKTSLKHGEYFTGLFSFFISNNLLTKMNDAFVKHNQILKQKAENER